MSVPHPFHVLQAIGLAEKAAAIYVALLHRQQMSIAELTRETGVKRATCYEHLAALLQRGFILRTPKGKRTLYSAVEPRKLLSDYKKKTDILEKSFEEMAQIHDAAVNKPRVVFYEGKRELQTIYEDLFKTVGDVYSIFPAEAFFQNFSAQEYDEFDKAISSHALRSKDLFLSDKYYKRVKEIRAKNGLDNKLDKRLPKDFKSNVDVLIYHNKVALMSLRDLSAIVIENQDIAELFRSIHVQLWQSIKR